MQSVLRNRIAPSVPLKLELEEDGGKRVVNFRLSWNFLASAEVEERTGLNLLTGEAWTKLSARNLGIMLWAAALAHHPDYGARMEGESFEQFEEAKKQRQGEGLECVLSYIDLGNADQVNEAVWNAYFLSLPKEKREALESARKALMEGIKPVRPQAAETSESPSDGSNSGQSQDTISALASKSLETSPTLNSTLSLTDTLSASGATCSVPAQSPPLSPTVLHSATPIGSL